MNAPERTTLNYVKESDFQTERLVETYSAAALGLLQYLARPLNVAFADNQDEIFGYAYTAFDFEQCARFRHVAGETIDTRTTIK